MSIDVVVTQEHIDNGTPCDHMSCPIALSLLAMGYSGVSVAEDVICAVPPGGDLLRPISYRPSPSAVAFMNLYDRCDGDYVKWINGPAAVDREINPPLHFKLTKIQ